MGCWDFSILCRFTSCGKLCVGAKEEGEGWLRASFPGIVQQVPGSHLAAGGSSVLMVLLLIFLLFLKLLVETSYGLKPTAFKHQPSGSTIYGFVTLVSLSSLLLQG